jgi:hypothetical protein
MDIKNARRKSFDVTYVIVSEENIEEVATWCNGEIGGEGKERFVKIIDKNAISTRQAKAFVDDYVLKMSETGTSFKAFTEKAFKKSFEPVVGSAGHKTIARSAGTGMFVSHKEAEANPDTTVVETISHVEEPDHPVPVKKSESLDGPKHGQSYWEVHDDETVYFNAAGETITKAEYDAWGK